MGPRPVCFDIKNALWVVLGSSISVDKKMLLSGGRRDSKTVFSFMPIVIAQNIVQYTIDSITLSFGIIQPLEKNKTETFA